jgi:hypothetical protein
MRNLIIFLAIFVVTNQCNAGRFRIFQQPTQTQKPVQKELTPPAPVVDEEINYILLEPREDSFTTNPINYIMI